LFSIALSILLGLIGRAGAATIEAKSASFADVSSAVGSAKTGDTVIVPTGTATWTTPLNITDNITLQGAGAGSTVIIDEVSRGSMLQAKEGEERGHGQR